MPRNSPVAGRSGAVRIQRLSGVALAAAEAHGKRLDRNGRARAVHPDAPALSTTGLDLARLLEAHVDGAKVQRSQTKCLHMIVQFPTALVDGEDAKAMLREARAFAASIFGDRAVFADRVDRDERSRHVVDLFLAPLYEKRTKHTAALALSTSRDLKALAATRGKAPSLWGQGIALQDAWHEHLRDGMGLAAERGAAKARPGQDWQTPEALELERQQEEAQRLRAEAEAEREARAQERSHAAGLLAAARIEAEQVEQRAKDARKEVKRLATQAEGLKRKVAGAEAALVMAQAREEAARTEAARLQGAAREAERQARAAEARARDQDERTRQVLDAQRQAEKGAKTSEDKARRAKADLAARETAIAAREAKLVAGEKDLATTLQRVERTIGNVCWTMDQAVAGTHDDELGPDRMADQPERLAALKAAAPDGRPTRGFWGRFWALHAPDTGKAFPFPDATRTALARAFDRIASWAGEVGAQRQALGAREAAVAAKEGALAVEQEGLKTTLEWVERGTLNLQAAVRCVQAGTHDDELRPHDMADQPEKFAVLTAAAPDGKPTWGFRLRFWSLHGSITGRPAPLPEAVRRTITTAFDQVAAWAGEMATQRAAAARLAREAEAKLADADALAARIVAEAKARAEAGFTPDAVVRGYAALLDLMKSKSREVFGADGHQRLVDAVRPAWDKHPDNINRPVERPRPSAGPSGP